MPGPTENRTRVKPFPIVDNIAIVISQTSQSTFTLRSYIQIASMSSSIFMLPPTRDITKVKDHISKSPVWFSYSTDLIVCKVPVCWFTR